MCRRDDERNGVSNEGGLGVVIVGEAAHGCLRLWNEIGTVAGSMNINIIRIHPSGQTHSVPLGHIGQHCKVSVALVSDEQVAVTISRESSWVHEEFTRRGVDKIIAQWVTLELRWGACRRQAPLFVAVCAHPHLVVVVCCEEDSAVTVLHIGNVNHSG